MSLADLQGALKARGHFGHRGLPGRRGGSAPGSGTPKKINGVPLNQDAQDAYSRTIKKYTALKWRNTFNSYLYNNAGGKREINAGDISEADSYTQDQIAKSKK